MDWLSKNERSKLLDVDEGRCWLQSEAIEFAKKLEFIAQIHDHHIALTGGCLYKKNLRKDCDIIIYSCRQGSLNHHKVIAAFAVEFNLELFSHSDWLTKATMPDGKNIDFLCPEAIRTDADHY